MLHPHSLVQLRFYLLKSIFGDCFPLFMNREEKDTFLGSDSSYTIINVQSRPDAHALKVHFPPSSIKRSPGVAWGHWPPADLYLYERSLIQCVSQWNGELLTQGTKPCSSILIWEGQPLCLLTATHLHTLGFYRMLRFMGHGLTSLLSNLTCSCSEFYSECEGHTHKFLMKCCKLSHFG